jgi:hypothetical protein
MKKMILLLSLIFCVICCNRSKVNSKIEEEEQKLIEIQDVNVIDSTILNIFKSLDIKNIKKIYGSQFTSGVLSDTPRKYYHNLDTGFIGVYFFINKNQDEDVNPFSAKMTIYNPLSDWKNPQRDSLIELIVYDNKINISSLQVGMSINVLDSIDVKFETYKCVNYYKDSVGGLLIASFDSLEIISKIKIGVYDPELLNENLVKILEKW